MKNRTMLMVGSFVAAVALAIPLLAGSGFGLTPLGVDTFCDDAGYGEYEFVPKPYGVRAAIHLQDVAVVHNAYTKWRVNGGAVQTGGAIESLSGGVTNWLVTSTTIDTSGMTRYDVLEIWFELTMALPDGTQYIGWSTYGTPAHYTVEISLDC